MTDAFEWRGQTGDNWAAQWRRTDRSFGQLTERLLEKTREFDFDRVLDIGCGAGELALAIARGRPAARVTGIDLSDALIAVARERGENLGNATFEAGDAAAWTPPADAAPQLLVSRHGVMFFADPLQAFTHFAAVAAPGAGLLFSCFRAPDENPLFSEVGRLLPDRPPPPEPLAPGPFGFADRALTEDLLFRAGWRDIAFEPLDFAMIVGAGEDPVEDALGYFTAVGPAASAARTMTEPERTRLVERVRAFADRNRHGEIVALRAAVWIVTARSAGS